MVLEIAMKIEQTNLLWLGLRATLSPEYFGMGGHRCVLRLEGGEEVIKDVLRKVEKFEERKRVLFRAGLATLGAR
jgi:hypothetical protein